MAASRLGARVEVWSALPEAAVALLTTERVRVRDLRRPGEPHAVTVALSTRSDRSFITVDGANERLEARLLAALGRGRLQARHLHLALGPRDLEAWTEVLHRCRRQSITTSWDFGWHASLPRRNGFTALVAALDWLFLNEREARHYAGAATLRAACRRWPMMARGTVIKRGARGAAAFVAGARLEAPAPRVRVVDTTGAGDAFNGGFLAALLTGQSLGACLRAGVRVGSAATGAAGGLDGLPAGPSRRRSSRGQG